MKKILLIFIIVMNIIVLLNSQELLNEGDNLLIYIKNNLVKYKINEFNISKWEEGIVTFYSYSKNIDGKTPIIMFANSKYPIGVLQGMKPDAYFIFDTNGDGILDTKLDNIVLPYWVVYENSINKTKNNNISNMLDLMYSSFQSNEGPQNNPNMIESFKIMDSYKNDINLENRDLVYLFVFITKYSKEYFLQCLDALLLFDEQYTNRFNKTHPLCLLYKAETYMNIGEIKKAKDLINKLRKLDPEFIPAKVYEYQLEKNKVKKKSLLSELKKKHGKHWIVKQL